MMVEETACYLYLCEVTFTVDTVTSASIKQSERMTTGPAETLVFLYFHAIHHGELPNSLSFSKREWEVIGSHPMLPILRLCAPALCFSRSHSSATVFR